MGQPEAEIAIYDGIVADFSDAENLELRVQLAKALYNKGYMLCEIGRDGDGIASFDEVLRRFGGSTEPRLRESEVIEWVEFAKEEKAKLVRKQTESSR